MLSPGSLAAWIEWEDVKAGGIARFDEDASVGSGRRDSGEFGCTFRIEGLTPTA
jgi:hypothetical protein